MVVERVLAPFIYCFFCDFLFIGGGGLVPIKRKSQKKQ
jgi:hypothetical protein